MSNTTEDSCKSVNSTEKNNEQILIEDGEKSDQSNKILENEWQCTEVGCDIAFSSKDDVHAHMSVHYKKGHYPCAFCPRVLNCKSRLAFHEVIHRDASLRKFGCDECQKRFNYEHDLKTHLLIHRGVKEFSCQHCGQMFTKKCNLVTHERIHNEDDKPFACKHCPKRYAQKVTLTYHELSHTTSEKQFSCKHCDKKFTYKSGLYQHVKIHLRPFACNSCALTFKSQDSLEKHERWHNKKDSNPEKTNLPSLGLTCTSGCKLTFKSQESLSRHELWHNKKRGYQCEQCSRTFKRRLLLEKHLKRAHSYDRPFGCRTCDKKFKIKSHLDQHERLHNEDMRFMCEHCPKSFTQRSGLLRHMEINHADQNADHLKGKRELVHRITPMNQGQNNYSIPLVVEKRFICSLCHKEFKSRHNLVQHEKKIHGECSRPTNLNYDGDLAVGHKQPKINKPPEPVMPTHIVSAPYVIEHHRPAFHPPSTSFQQCYLGQIGGTQQMIPGVETANSRQPEFTNPPQWDNLWNLQHCQFINHNINNNPNTISNRPRGEGGHVRPPSKSIRPLNF